MSVNSRSYNVKFVGTLVLKVVLAFVVLSPTLTVAAPTPNTLPAQVSVKATLSKRVVDVVIRVTSELQPSRLNLYLYRAEVRNAASKAPGINGFRRFKYIREIKNVSRDKAIFVKDRLANRFGNFAYLAILSTQSSSKYQRALGRLPSVITARDFGTVN